MARIYQAMAARVIECELKVKPQTAGRVSAARGPGSSTRLFIISLKGRSTVPWITLATKLTACSPSALPHFRSSSDHRKTESTPCGPSGHWFEESKDLMIILRHHHEGLAWIELMKQNRKADGQFPIRSEAEARGRVFPDVTSTEEDDIKPVWAMLKFHAWARP